ncbi:TldD/PmbA family protein [Phytoactinopolyspora alkaliphila]|uniref:TldD/PmbA family protein n=1 Tax=Phytoactinopolyspora alkaliphila TaxID=1783498 RepID=A0A6N9YTT7_9ACTN|nr:metallopeptidase TldD-related protein [Phytoactinopolyspora alkaliphila]NED98385.1 TldD/PmbA family protein [Phytoactinopolyspora alkaliphila]
MTPQEIVERCLGLSKAHGTTVLVDETSTANLRWANNALTTNGVMHDRQVTVMATVEDGTGVASGVVARNAVTSEDLEPLVRAAEQAARTNGPAEDARPLVTGDASPDWTEPPALTSASAFTTVAPALGDAFERARSGHRLLFGYVEDVLTTTYLGNSVGLALRHAQPSGHITTTGMSADRSASAWAGQSFLTPSDIDVAGLDAELHRRLTWSERTIALPPGHYDTVLPPSAVADLMIYAYFSMGARDAHEGRTVFATPGQGTRVGDRLSPHPVSLWSDPVAPGLESAPFALARASSSVQSVFDNGLPLQRTEWISDGRLSALMHTRHAADITGLPVTPGIENLGMTVAEGSGTVDDLAAQVEDGLLLTCLWYIREVDPQRLLLTGLTRDGVYQVRNGEVTGAVNNFRFNESPVELLERFTQAGATGPAFGRELGEFFPRTAMPALRVPDFNMSSVSQAS